MLSAELTALITIFALFQTFLSTKCPSLIIIIMIFSALRVVSVPSHPLRDSVSLRLGVFLHVCFWISGIQTNFLSGRDEDMAWSAQLNG